MQEAKKKRRPRAEGATGAAGHPAVPPPRCPLARLGTDAPAHFATAEPPYQRCGRFRARHIYAETPALMATKLASLNFLQITTGFATLRYSA